MIPLTVPLVDEADVDAVRRVLLSGQLVQGPQVVAFEEAIRKVVGNAVVRNRIKRQVREFFRRHRGELPGSTDYLIIARGGAAALPAERLAAELAQAIMPPSRRPCRPS